MRNPFSRASRSFRTAFARVGKSCKTAWCSFSCCHHRDPESKLPVRVGPKSGSTASLNQMGFQTYWATREPTVWVAFRNNLFPAWAHNLLPRRCLSGR
ncbi:MAG: hypothetical protein WAL98_00905 [Desulfatiglandaceae bacterium]